MNLKTGGRAGGGRHRPVDLAREHGISTQAVRNYERDGVLPPAERTPSGYRSYSDVHVRALRAYLALVPAHGYAAAGEIMRAANRGELDAALASVDRSHAQLLHDRETLDAVEAAVATLGRSAAASGGPAAGAPPSGPPDAAADRPFSVGQLAHRLGLAPATLRKWERAGILVPQRDPRTHHRSYTAGDVRDARLAHLLRRGGFPPAHIATVLHQVRGAGGPEALALSLGDWRQRLTDRGRAMLTAAGELAEYLRAQETGSAAAGSTARSCRGATPAGPGATTPTEVA
ncbi:TioE family transcriptional regulator [Kitasatospora sp. NPDC090091]|uniref:TioE family transcriptional regulator n=1 Tax=Kitasatospora sp. NPDC090091 TaxID=3364081 RepID=UPI0038190767